ncbi:MAG: RNA-binding S4 domain-containing protein [Peptococcaceae bacterium]|nr:RNA-binding S4 domain-containing protein [Peptococcaceae bacterium]
MRRVSVRGSIRLDQFLKWSGVVTTGGRGKALVRSGLVRVNGERILSRGRMLSDGDLVSVEGIGDFLVAGGGSPSSPDSGEKK